MTDGRTKRQRDDKERILLTLLHRLRFRATAITPNEIAGMGAYVDGRMMSREGQPKRGDLVLCASTRQAHDWFVAWYVRPIPDGALLREIGSDRECRVVNEDFRPIRGIDPDLLLEGAEHRFAERIERVFRRAWPRPTSYLCASVGFEEGRICRVIVRDYFSGHRGDNTESKPFAVRFPWRAKMTNAAIRAALSGVRARSRYGQRGEGGPVSR